MVLQGLLGPRDGEVDRHSITMTTQLPPTLTEGFPCAHAALLVGGLMIALALGAMARGWISGKIRERVDDDGEPTTYEEDE